MYLILIVTKQKIFKYHIFCEVQNKTSKYTGVTWDQSYKKIRKWKARLIHNKKSYSCGYFHHEEEAAMSVNFLCDKLGIKRKNPKINKDTIQEVTLSSYIHLLF